MKKLLLIIATIFLIISCSSPQNIAKDANNQTSMKPEKNDDGEWDLDVIDTQYDYFLNAIAKPMSFYSEEYLKSRNTFLVNEWNSYYYSGRYRNIIESSIDYDPNEKYGLKFEYKLYQVFAYVQWKYGLKLQGLSMTEVR
ncbi:DUF6146 family protein [Cloacibacterium normanense]|uniref:Lipoprotein n=1 Tax=Cloacibacterium normanense TaxID=237258 RepID=A0A1E5UBV2_9FLAO|nr:DUF6146 family protein [Cloacibacterium normanense]AZI70567.1 hypothetical protein EB819_12035 [Cloacibacterium normanense]OEL10414.1 hypothetical protein BHF72_0506 [Cloacibacterium normanense]SDO49370.1 hypothetical protein SAMN04489756_10839 [Cloacibacterium normanense]